MSDSPLSREIANEQKNLFLVLRKLDVLPRLGIGLASSSVLAFYIPLLFFTFLGMWINTLHMWFANLICILVLLVVNLVGYSIKRIMFTGVICAFLLGGYVLTLVIRTTWDWKFSFIQVAHPVITIILNAYFFSKYIKYVGLKSR